MEIDVTQTNLAASLGLSSQVVRNTVASEQELRKESETNLNAKTNQLDANVEKQSADNDTNSSEVSVSSELDLDVAVEEISEFVQSQRRNLDFTFNDEANRSIVKVTDTDTGEVIRQIPSEEVLALSQRIKGLQSDDVGQAVGVLFSREV